MTKTQQSLLAAAARFKVTLDRLHTQYREDQTETSAQRDSLQKELDAVESLLKTSLLEGNAGLVSQLFSHRERLKNQQSGVLARDMTNMVLYDLFGELYYCYALEAHFDKAEWDAAIAEEMRPLSSPGGEDAPF